MKPRFFATPAEFRAWLEAHHHDTAELWVGFYKRGSGRPSITWPESVDEALCFGWIDGIRKSIDEESYRIRFTPRRPKSNWSLVNLRRVAVLKKLKRMRAAGLAAFEARDPDAEGRAYSFEQRKTARLSPAHERLFRRNARAWAFYQTLPPWYHHQSAFWVESAKKEETRLARLEQVIENCAAGRDVRALRRPKPGRRA